MYQRTPQRVQWCSPHSCRSCGSWFVRYLKQPCFNRVTWHYNRLFGPLSPANHRCTLIPLYSLHIPINSCQILPLTHTRGSIKSPSSVPWDVGGNWREPTCSQGEHANSTEQHLWSGLNPGSLELWGSNSIICTTLPHRVFIYWFD